MRSPEAAKIGTYLAAAALPLGAAAIFWVPALEAARGFFPAPLDDVYIHFDFARSLAAGHPFEWIPGQGYSSGETSPLYAAVLAIGCLAGLRGKLLGVWAAVVAVVALTSLVRSVQALVRPCPAWLAWLLSALPLSVGVVDWTLFSGMEVAVFAGALGRALVALDRTRSPIARRRGETRERAAWRLGLWGAALVLLRPEAGVLVAIFAVIAARGAGARSGLAAVARAASPGALATLSVAAMNRLATGDAASAGARLKLLSSNPYLSDVERARAFVENLVTFALRGALAELSAWPSAALLVPALAALSLVPRARRPVGAACLAGALGWTLLASWNGASPFHNFRYYAPALVLLLIGASVGLAALARAPWLRGRGAIASAALALLVVGAAAPRLVAQSRHFRRAVANVRGQQIEAGARLARATPANARVLLGDAGAIPFVSRRAAVDALGLGGYRGLPFARAAVFGEAATVELIERLAPNERPTHMALYPNWFGVITSRFGREIDRVTITDNVICGGPIKGIYVADWSALEEEHVASAAVVDEIDVGDVVSEAEHAYAPPLPHGGWTTLDVLDDRAGARRFDAGRIIPARTRESFAVRRAPRGRALVRVRTDARSAPIHVRARGAVLPLVAAPGEPGSWRTAVATLDALRAGDRIVLEAEGGEYRDYHVWIERAP